jgi:hypothetical protein
MDLDGDGDYDGWGIILFPPVAIALILIGIGLIVITYHPELLPLALSFIPNQYPQEIKQFVSNVESSVFLFSGIGFITVGSGLLGFEVWEDRKERRDVSVID